MTKKKLILISGILFIAMTTIAIYYYKAHQNNMPFYPQGVWVETAPVKETSLPMVAHSIGTLVARSVEITPEVAGHVEKILFRDGAFVSKDAILIQLDDKNYRSQFLSAKAKYVYAERDFKRLSSLAKKSYLSQRDIDKSELDLKEKKADADQIEVTLNKMALKAPFDGTVGKSKVNQGDFVTVGQSVVTLTDTKHLRVEYTLPEKFLPLLKIGQDVQITSVAYPGKIFHGQVSFIAPTINTDNRSISLYADVLNTENVLVSGMFVNVTQSLGSAEHVLMIPSRSLVPIMDGVQVFKVIDKKAYAVNVQIGHRTETQVQILQGLNAGDIVITDGQHKVRNGLPVEIKSNV